MLHEDQIYITFVIVQDPSVCFVISSDFCHWGDRFHYTHYDSAAGEIHQSIKVGVLSPGRGPWL